MTLTPLPAFDDNYLWLLDNGREALVVDPGDAAPVAAALDARRLTLAGILLTHHHGDHVGGVEALRPRLQGPVYGPARDRMPEPVTRVSGGDTIELLGLRFAVLDVPGHTAGHVAYFCADVPGQAPLLFCGDALFSAGCGRLFEGTPAQMHASLQSLAALPGATRVCCAHEYTLSNLRFAREVDPHNAVLAAHAAWAEGQRSAGQPTLPVPLGTETRINPFLRCAEPALREAARRHAPLQLPAEPSPVDVFATLREWKNGFR
ncbi:hydroxyacylglutathione hydrolase [Pelomonas cellulosilytica]|uniref:Hydroxyacylglutathione hydrolase n=1 Tax=Pelomonas cellulosilytica TaxID=2906762 RepID=A0ABS8XP30_9BURK|nr:hydroxyacylglutathione hydrolase [Pelomonas sp. P8]MCE4553417.1 hydroxyacylglutathione hydrolase [Pelomonas sp. P8]